MTSRPASPRRALRTSPFAVPAALPPASEVVEVGDRVTHDRLGMGRVTRVADDETVIVTFSTDQGASRAVSVRKLTNLER